MGPKRVGRGRHRYCTVEDLADPNAPQPMTEDQVSQSPQEAAAAPIEQDPPIHQTLATMTRLVEHQTQLIEQQMAFFHRQAAQPGTSTSQMELQLTPYERFRKYGPSNFSGSADSIEAENWIIGMERIFSIMEVSDTQRVALASFMLEGDARYWWEATQRQLDPNSLDAITWFEFTQAFYNKYFPASFRRTKELEFLNLKQGELGVAEYELKFTKLSRFAPTLDLREEVTQREQCSNQPSSSGLAKSYRPPKSGGFTQSFFESKTNSQRGPSSSYRSGGAFSQTEQKRGRANITRSQNCQYERTYGTKLYVALPSAVRSSSMGNRPSQVRGRGQMSSNQSLQSRGGGSMVSLAGQANRPMMQGRVFTLTKRDADATPTVVTDTLNLFNRPAHDFDVILGMDWLASHQAYVECYKKEIVFRLLNEPEFKFCGDSWSVPFKFISFLK
ncbi:hypothetical protein CRG98_011998, partial [Punica granatum]